MTDRSLASPREIDYSSRWLWVVVTAIGLLASCQEASEVCGGLASPLLVGKWEATSPTALSRAIPAAAEQELTLFLYPEGAAIKNGQRGNWKVVTCEGPTVIIDLSRRMQTGSCELRVDGVARSNPPSVHLMDVDRVLGRLTCAGKSIGVRRTETRGWIPTAFAASATREREKNLRYQQELMKRTGWSRLWLRILHKLG